MHRRITCQLKKKKEIKQQKETKKEDGYKAMPSIQHFHYLSPSYLNEQIENRSQDFHQITAGAWK